MSSSSCSMQNSRDCESIFRKKLFFLIGLPEKTLETVLRIIGKRHGTITCKYGENVDFMIVPIFSRGTKVTATVFNYLWILDCDLYNCLVTPTYYHLPIIDEFKVKPLKNCVVSIRNFSENETIFIRDALIEFGAVFQHSLSQKDRETFKKNTHLISNYNIGKEHPAAANWGTPIVTHEWMISCTRYRCKSNEVTYGISLEPSQQKRDYTPIKLKEITSSKSLQLGESKIDNNNASKYSKMTKNEIKYTKNELVRKNPPSPKMQQLAKNRKGEPKFMDTFDDDDDNDESMTSSQAVALDEKIRKQLKQIEEMFSNMGNNCHKHQEVKHFDDQKMHLRHFQCSVSCNKESEQSVIWVDPINSPSPPETKEKF